MTQREKLLEEINELLKQLQVQLEEGESLADSMSIGVAPPLEIVNQGTSKSPWYDSGCEWYDSGCVM